MNTRKLCGQGPDVTECGLGCWQIGGGWGNPWSDATAQEILASAYSSGVHFFDTADGYGNGESERSLGAFRKQHPDILIATKLGRGTGIYPDGYTRQALQTATELSLERLGVDCIDLTQLHCVPLDVLRQGDVFDWLRRQRDEGLVARFGASSPEQARANASVSAMPRLSDDLHERLARLYEDEIHDLVRGPY